MDDDPPPGGPRTLQYPQPGNDNIGAEHGDETTLANGPADFQDVLVILAAWNPTLQGNTVVISDDKKKERITSTKWIISAGSSKKYRLTKKMIWDTDDETLNTDEYDSIQEIATTIRAWTPVVQVWDNDTVQSWVESMAPHSSPNPHSTESNMLYEMIATLHSRIQYCEHVDLQCYKKH